MTRSQVGHLLLCLGVAAGAIAFQGVVHCPRGSMWWSAVFDLGHVPLFGVLALMILQASRLLWRGRSRSGWRHYGAALVVSVLVSGLTELAQYVGPRDADPRDVIRNVIGVVAMLLLARSRDGDRGGRWCMRVIAAGLVMIVSIPVATLTVAYRQRDAAFPRICDFEHGWETTFLHTQDADLAREAAAAEKGDGMAGRLTFRPATYPGLSFVEPHPDWRGYDQLVFEVYSDADTALALAVRIDDGEHDQRYWDRFNRRLTIQPGANRIAIDLAEVEQAPRGRRMDMTNVRNITLFAVEPEEPFTVYVDAVRLEMNRSQRLSRSSR